MELDRGSCADPGQLGQVGAVARRARPHHVQHPSVRVEVGHVGEAGHEDVQPLVGDARARSLDAAHRYDPLLLGDPLDGHRGARWMNNSSSHAPSFAHVPGRERGVRHHHVVREAKIATPQRDSACRRDGPHVEISRPRGPSGDEPMREVADVDVATTQPRDLASVQPVDEQSGPKAPHLLRPCHVLDEVEQCLRESPRPSGRIPQDADARASQPDPEVRLNEFRVHGAGGGEDGVTCGVLDEHGGQRHSVSLRTAPATNPRHEDDRWVGRRLHRVGPEPRQRGRLDRKRHRLLTQGLREEG